MIRLRKEGSLLDGARVPRFPSYMYVYALPGHITLHPAHADKSEGGIQWESSLDLVAFLIHPLPSKHRPLRALLFSNHHA